MNANHNMDAARAYFEGMLSAAFGAGVFSDSVAVLKMSLFCNPKETT